MSTLHSKSDIADVIKLMILRWGNYLDLGGPDPVKKLFRRGRHKFQNWSRGDDQNKCQTGADPEVKECFSLQNLKRGKEQILSWSL